MNVKHPNEVHPNDITTRYKSILQKKERRRCTFEDTTFLAYEVVT